MHSTTVIADEEVGRAFAPRPMVSIAPAPAVAEAAPRPSVWRRAAHVWLLLVITLFGGVLRFTRIDQPPLWADEAHTYSRVCGTYQQLIDILQYNGFVPLHYELYWWIRQGLPMRFTFAQAPVEHTGLPDRPSWFNFGARLRDASAPPVMKRELVPRSPLIAGGVRMTPLVMRLIPAIAGTLMAPAVCFLAIQLASRRVALVAALFAATSAYLLVYSRDAKMYMHFWLMCTLSVACLLWWIRTRTRVSWLCWVAASVAMCGLHATGLILLAIEGIIFVSAAPLWFRRSWWTLLPPAFFLLGVLIVGSGPYVYYRYFNHYPERVADQGWDNSGIEWVAWYNRGRSGPELVRETATAFLMSWEWPDLPQSVEEGAANWNRRPPMSPFRIMPVRRLRLLETAACVMLALLALGLLPWRRWTRARGRESDDAPIARTQPLRLLWLLAWLVVPAYGFYCASVDGFVGPQTWLGDALDALRRAIDGPHRTVAIVAMIVTALALGAGVFVVSGNTWSERLRSTVRPIVALVVVFGVCELTYFGFQQYLARGGELHSVWMPRYLGFCWPAVAVAVAILLMRLPTRPLRYGAVALFVAINLAQYAARAFGSSEPPSDRLAYDMYVAGLPEATTRTYSRLTDSFGFAPGQGLMFAPSWRYYMLLYSGVQATPMDLRLRYRAAVDRNFKVWTTAAPAPILRDLRGSPQIDRVIVWDRVELRGPDPLRDDPLKTQLTTDLGGTWRRTDESLYPARDHWTWQDLYTSRRREYVRLTAPVVATAAPATAPSSAPAK